MFIIIIIIIIIIIMKAIGSNFIVLRHALVGFLFPQGAPTKIRLASPPRAS